MGKRFLYESVADEIRQLIESDVLPAGQKLSSVRTLSEERNVSLSTAFKAYEELINMNLIESRPKSGYYVKKMTRRLPPVSVMNGSAGHQSLSVDQLIEFAHSKFSNEDIVRLSVTAPDIRLLPSTKLNKSMREALNAHADSCLNYELIEGNPELRYQVARHTFGWSGYSHPEEVVITQGCIEALVLSLMAITKPGDTVLIERPTYFSIYNIIRNLGLKVLEMDVHASTGLDLNLLERSIKSEQIHACIFISNFSNPTGYVMDEETKKELVGLLAKHEIPLIEDDIYGEIYFDQTRPSTCKQFDQNGLVLLCSSFSKTIAPGYRIGWCLPGRFKKKFLDIKLMHTVATSNPTQAAMAQFFKTGRYDLYIKKLRKNLQIQSLQYLDAISRYFPKGTRVTPPRGGFVLWIELARHVNAIELFYRALDHGISIWPGAIFSASGGFDNFIRISFGMVFDEKVENSLKVLGELCNGFDAPN